MRQIVDYSKPSKEAAFALAGALATLPPAPPPPEQLPEPPPAPLSYLSDLMDQASQTGSLTQEQQRQILNQLQPALRSADPEEREGGRYVLEMFCKRGDLYADVDRCVAQLAAGEGRVEARLKEARRQRDIAAWSRLIGGAAAAALVVGRVGAIILLSTHIIPWGGSGPTATTTKPPSVPPSGWTADDDTLIGYLSKPGYSRSNCTPQHPPTDNSLSTLECDALSGGPDSAKFFLYHDQRALDEGFNNVTSNVTLETCPDGTSSPGKWHYTKDPTATAGQLACGMDGSDAVVMWSEDSKDFVAVVRGSNLKDLFTWWQQKS